MKAVIGPTIAIRTDVYASSEALIGTPYRPDDPHIFVLRSNDLVEFLDMTAEESHENLLQAVSLSSSLRFRLTLNIHHFTL